MSVSDYVSSNNQLTSNCLATIIIHKTLLPILSSNWDAAFMFTLHSASVPMLPCKCEANTRMRFVRSLPWGLVAVLNSTVSSDGLVFSEKRDNLWHPFSFPPSC